MTMAPRVSANLDGRSRPPDHPPSPHQKTRCSSLPTLRWSSLIERFLATNAGANLLSLRARSTEHPNEGCCSPLREAQERAPLSPQTPRAPQQQAVVPFPIVGPLEVRCQREP